MESEFVGGNKVGPPQTEKGKVFGIQITVLGPEKKRGFEIGKRRSYVQIGKSLLIL